MADVATVAAVLLAVVFAVAGVAKLRRPVATAAAFAGLGLPAAGALAAMVPLSELGVAAVLMARPRAGGVLALVALGGFSVVLASASGRGVACGCFGTVSTAPVSWVDLVRNGLLGGLALASLGAGRPAAPGLEAVVLVTSAAAAGLVVLGLCRMRHEVGAVFDNRLAGERTPA